jgi:hypothetical protein
MISQYITVNNNRTEAGTKTPALHIERRKQTMATTKKILSLVNSIASKYSGYNQPSILQELYRELESIGVSIGLIHNRRDINRDSWQGSCEWYFNGQEIENSLFIMQVYEGNTMNDYTMCATKCLLVNAV